MSKYDSLRLQIQRSFQDLQMQCEKYLKNRNQDKYEKTFEEWKLHFLNIKVENEDPEPPSLDNELDKKIYKFYLNLHGLKELLQTDSEDIKNKIEDIQHSEDITMEAIDNIVIFFGNIQEIIHSNMLEANSVLNIESQDLKSHLVVDPDASLPRKVRSFLIIAKMIEEMKCMLKELPQDDATKETLQKYYPLTNCNEDYHQ